MLSKTRKEKEHYHTNYTTSTNRKKEIKKSMSHYVRLLNLSSPEEIAREMARVGVAPEGIRIMAPKAQPIFLRLENVRGKAAAVLKQLMLSLGGEACVSRHVAAFDDTPRPVLLIGDARHFARLVPRLANEPFGLQAIGKEIERVLACHAQTPPPLRWRHFDLDFTRTRIMGIINMTPDSFSGDGLGANVQAAIQQGVDFVAAGADILDVGGESTRPGSLGVSAEEELQRVLPVLEGLAARVDVPISIDSSKPEVCRLALSAGASIINDVYGLRRPGMLELAAEAGVPVIIMHMQGEPRTMQENPHYEDVMKEVYEFLADRIEAATEAGIKEEHIIIDPGFGFGKTREHNLELVRRLSEFRSLGRPILLGPSRKRTIGEITGKPVEQRIWGTAAMCAIGVLNGAHILRVHDVAAMIDVARVADAIVQRNTTA